MHVDVNVIEHSASQADHGTDAVLSRSMSTIDVMPSRAQPCHILDEQVPFSLIVQFPPRTAVQYRFPILGRIPTLELYFAKLPPHLIYTMPRAKRALEETDANAQAAPAAKNQKRSKKQEEAKKPSENVEKENAVEGCTSPCGKRQTTADKNPEDYICIPQPFPDFEYQQRESGGKAKSVNLDRQYNQTIIGPNEGKLLGLAQPGDKWVIMKAAWDLYKDLTRWETYCNPDNFGMYIYNDFYGYGVKALIEQQVSLIACAL